MVSSSTDPSALRHSRNLEAGLARLSFSELSIVSRSAFSVSTYQALINTVMYCNMSCVTCSHSFLRLCTTCAEEPDLLAAPHVGMQDTTDAWSLLKIEIASRLAWNLLFTTYIERQITTLSYPYTIALALSAPVALDRIPWYLDMSALTLTVS